MRVKTRAGRVGGYRYFKSTVDRSADLRSNRLRLCPADLILLGLFDGQNQHDHTERDRHVGEVEGRNQRR